MWPIVGTIAALALVVGLFFGIRWYNSTTPLPGPTPTSSIPNSQSATAILLQLDSISPTSAYAVRQGTAHNTLKRISAAPLVGADGKPIVLYLGAGYCPFCAAERWALVIALSRFGVFSNLSLTTSSSTDVYPDTATFDFYRSTYTSQYLTFQAIETTDRNQKPQQNPTASQQALFAQYDAAQNIPFIDFGNVYTLSGATYSPASLANLSALEIATQLQQPSSKVAQDILGSANLLTAALCPLAPAAPVCSDPNIKALKQP